MLTSGSIRFEPPKPVYLPSLNPDPKTVDDGHKEALKEFVKQEDLSQSKLQQMINKSDQVLFRLSTFFPFDFFPDDIIIDLEKVNIIIRYFFLAEQVHSVYIKDITDVVLETGPFFALLRIIDKDYTENSIDLHYLKKSEAIKARRIIQGLVIAHKEGVDLSPFSIAEITTQIEKLGSTNRTA